MYLFWYNYRDNKGYNWCLSSIKDVNPNFYNEDYRNGFNFILEYE